MERLKKTTTGAIESYGETGLGALELRIGSLIIGSLIIPLPNDPDKRTVEITVTSEPSDEAEHSIGKD